MIALYLLIGIPTLAWLIFVGFGNEPGVIMGNDPADRKRSDRNVFEEDWKQKLEESFRNLEQKLKEVDEAMRKFAETFNQDR